MFSIIEKHHEANFNRLVKKFSFRLTKEEAEDVVQEAYYRALKYAPSFEMGTSFTRWFNTILANARRDLLIEKYREGMHEDVDDHVDVLADLGVDFEAGSIREFLEGEIKNVANPSHSQVLRLYFVFHYPLCDIVEITEESYANARQIIQRFKVVLKERINEENMRRGLGS